MRFQCPNCKEILSVDNAEIGAKVQCGKCQQIVTVPASRTAPGAVIADFIIEKELGRGGMGVVYLSHQISLDRSAALKILAENYAQNSEFVISFIKEARAAARLNHPHIVQAYAVGEDDGIYYFAMENVDGLTMKEILEKNHVIPVDQAVQIVQQIAEALDYAWKEQKLIHRDIKPDNLFYMSDGTVKISDFGISTSIGMKPSGDSIQGTIYYCAPEVLMGRPAEIANDIYSMGVVFFEMLTGHVPVDGKDPEEIAVKQVRSRFPEVSKFVPSIPVMIDRIIAQACRKRPEERYLTAEEFHDAILRAMNDKEQFKERKGLLQRLFGFK